MSDRYRAAAVFVGGVGVALAVGMLPPVAAGTPGLESARGISAVRAVARVAPSGRIVFTRTRCPNFGHDDPCQGPTRLYVTDADGTDQRRLGVGHGPVRSPDGRWMAFDSSNGVEWGIQVGHADGTQVKWLAAGGGPAWSPDSRWIMYEVGRPNLQSEVYKIRRDGTDKIRLAAWSFPTQRSGHTWSPDGRRIAFRIITGTATGGQITHTDVMNADGTEVKQLDVAPLGQFSAPVWSPDGRWIMWDQEELRRSSADPQRWGVYVIRPDGTGKRRLAAGSSPVWSPDGRRIVFDSLDRRLRTFLAVMDADGSHVKRVTQTYSTPLWSPNGRWIAFHRPVGSPSSRRRYQVWVVRADGTHVKKLSRGVPWAWSPDGRRIVFTRYTGDRGILSVMDADGSHRRRVTPSRRYEYYQRAAWFGAAPTRTTLNARPESVAKGARLTVTGKVTKTGIALPAATVRIRFKRTGAHRFTTVTAVTTGASGRYREQ